MLRVVGPIASAVSPKRDPLGARGDAARERRATARQIPATLGPLDSIDRPATRAEIYLAGGGEGYGGDPVILDYANQRAEKYPDREIYYFNHLEGFRAPKTMRDLNRRNVPIDVVAYSWGAPTGMSAIHDSGAKVDFLATIDGVGRFETLSGVRPRSIDRWYDVTASPPESAGRLDRNGSDLVAWAGGKPSALPIGQADRSIDVSTNHNEFPLMMRRSGVEAKLNGRPPAGRR